MQARTAARLILATLVLAVAQSCSDNEHPESATGARSGIVDDSDSHYDARFGEVLVRVPESFLPLDLSWYREHERSYLPLRKMPWPPDANTFNIVPEGRYIDVTLYRTDSQPGSLQEDRFKVLDDQENWGETGLRRLVYNLGPSLGAAFGTKVFVSEDGRMRALCSQGRSAATRACRNEHLRREGYPEMMHICYPQSIEEIIDSDVPLNARCQARQDYSGGLTVVYDFSELRIIDWPEIDEFIRSLIESWMIAPIDAAHSGVSSE